MGNKGRSLRPLPARPPRRTQKAGDCSGFWEALKGSRRAGGALFFAPALERWPQAPGLFLWGGGLPLPFGKLPACGPSLRGRPDAPKKQGIALAFGKPSRVPGAQAGRFFLRRPWRGGLKPPAPLRAGIPPAFLKASGIRTPPAGALGGLPLPQASDIPLQGPRCAGRWAASPLSRAPAGARPLKEAPLRRKKISSSFFLRSP